MTVTPSPQSVVVPVEPTEGMMACAEQASQMLEWQIKASWSAMLAAAPAAPQAAGVGERGLSAEKLRELRDNAARASTDKERGDRWHRSHGCVIALPKMQAGGNYGATVFLPATGDKYVAPYKPDPARESDFARHAVGADPRTVIQLVEEILALRAPSREPEGGAGMILKGVGKIDGDGWKDTTRKGEVVFVWNAEKPSPYAPGQYPRIGNEGWSASTAQYDFMPATVQEVRDLFAALATREEAPAEGAGELDPSQANDWLEWTRLEGGSPKIDEIKRAHEAIRSALRARSSAPEAREEAPAEAGEDDVRLSIKLAIVANVSIGEGRFSGIEAATDRILSVLRAQPQAREEAQPVAKVVSAHGDPEAFGEREIEVLTDLRSIPYNTPLYATPPAPEAEKLLRQWVEAFESLGSGSGPLINETRAYLAALQQEGR